MYYSAINAKIEAQEAKDRYVASECLKWLIPNGRDLEINPTKITDYVDLNCSVVIPNGFKVPFNVEIKERFKNEEQLKKYPHAELKVDKLERMKSVTPEDTSLLYMVLLNNKTCFIFNMDKLDWSKVETRKWRIKRTQLNPNSDYITVPTHFIPYELAVATMDCSNFFQQYESELLKNNNK